MGLVLQESVAHADVDSGHQYLVRATYKLLQPANGTFFIHICSPNQSAVPSLDSIKPLSVFPRHISSGMPPGGSELMVS